MTKDETAKRSCRDLRIIWFVHTAAAIIAGIVIVRIVSSNQLLSPFEAMLGASAVSTCIVCLYWSVYRLLRINPLPETLGHYGRILCFLPIILMLLSAHDPVSTLLFQEPGSYFYSSILVSPFVCNIVVLFFVCRWLDAKAVE